MIKYPCMCEIVYEFSGASYRINHPDCEVHGDWTWKNCKGGGCVKCRNTCRKDQPHPACCPHRADKPTLACKKCRDTGTIEVTWVVPSELGDPRHVEGTSWCPHCDRGEEMREFLD